MTVTSVRKLSDISYRIALGEDPRQTLIDAIGKNNIDAYHPSFRLVLVATYVRSNMSKGGIILGGDNTLGENRFQGKVGLVLKLGPGCFEHPQFGGFKVEPGDWVHYRTSDADEFFFVDEDTGLDGASVRLVDDTLIKAKVDDPQKVF
jgi:hypothetical protein